MLWCNLLLQYVLWTETKFTNISKLLKKKIRKEIMIKIYKTVVVPSFVVDDEEDWKYKTSSRNDISEKREKMSSCE